MISVVCRFIIVFVCACGCTSVCVSLCVYIHAHVCACWINRLVLTLAANSRGPYAAASASTSRGHLPSQQPASHLFSHPPSSSSSSSSSQLSGHRVKYIRPLLTDTDVALQNWWQPFYTWFLTHSHTNPHIHLVGRLRRWRWKRLSVFDTMLHVGDTNKHTLFSLIVCIFFPLVLFWC